MGSNGEKQNIDWTI